MSERWSTPSIVLHWLSAVALLVVVVAGLVLQELPADAGARRVLSGMHSVLGIALVVMTVARLVVLRRLGRAAPLPLPPLHALVVRAVHVASYATLIAVGVTGFATAKPSQWHEFIKGDVPTAPDFADVASRQVHEALVLLLGALLVAHVAGVVVQQLRPGGVLRRMLPGR